MKIAILTNSYPYYPGEQFLEEEILYWNDFPSRKIILIPLSSKGSPRKTPKNVGIDLSLKDKNHVLRFLFIFWSLVSPLFIYELKYLFLKRKFNFRCIIIALLNVSKVISIESKLKKVILKNKGFDFVYCYWNDNMSYAAALLKRKGLINKLIVRTHRYDLYEEDRESNYMPLKRQFVDDFDIIFALSEEGKNYYEKKFNAKPSNVKISPLGVSIPPSLSEPSILGYLHLVSVSFCVHVKRIDKIIDAIDLFSDKNPYVYVKWTHIGDGPLFSELVKMAQKKLSLKKNLEFAFKGNLTNSLVRAFFLNERVDLFINTSESEGIPVSAMEAMSYGVPIIAPDIGGISFLLSENCGKLLSRSPSIQEIASSISEFTTSKCISQMRLNARQKIIADYNASLNYKLHIQKISSLVT